MKLLVILLCFLSFSAVAQRNKEANTAVSKHPYEVGRMVDGRPVGIWEYYDDQGTMELKMNYDSSRIVYSRPDTARYLLRVGQDWQLAQPTRAPRFLGSQAKRMQDINRALRYPLQALRQKEQGVVTISYVVDKQGHTSDYQVESSFSPVCTQAVWQVIKDLPDQWVPAVYQGQLTEARFFLSVTFRMMRESELKKEIKQQQAKPLDERTLPPYTQHMVVIAFEP